MALHRIIGYALFLALLTAAVINSKTFFTLIDYSTLILVLGGALAVTVMSGTFPGPAKSTRHRRMIGYAFLIGLVITSLIGVMEGMIRMLGTLTEPSQIGPPMATAILSCLYGNLAMALFPIPLIDHYAKKTQTYDHPPLIRLAWIGFPVFSVFLLLLSFMILLASLGYLES